MTTHELEINRKDFNAVTSLTKTFEIRYNDRYYQVGDILKLRVYRNNAYTGDEAHFRVTYVLTCGDTPGLSPGFVALAIVPAYPCAP